MAKKITSAQIKKMIKDEEILIGTQRALKNLRLGKVKQILLSSNCPERVEKDVNYYAKLTDTDVQKLSYPNDELGIMCKKPFSISVLASVKKV
jgi:large subunit ribosomal protein L30e